MPHIFIIVLASAAKQSESMASDTRLLHPAVAGFAMTFYFSENEWLAALVLIRGFDELSPYNVFEPQIQTDFNRWN
jgi:hypothetical protein